MSWKTIHPRAALAKIQAILADWQDRVLNNPLIVRGEVVLTARRIVRYAWLRFVKRWLGLDVNFREGIQSDVKIDVVIPAAIKDAAVLPFAIAGLKRNIKHPIGKIIIVSPRSDVIKKICKQHGCVWADELKIAPIAKEKINYVSEGVDRSGWLFQQFLKLSADKASSQEYILLVDADTIFLRPHVFLFKGKVIFEQSMEYHKPYFVVFEKLFGSKPPSPLSFTSHHMLVTRSVLREMREELEKRHKKAWYQAILDNIDTKEFSAVSDYETYGIFFALKYPRQMITQFWSHLDLLATRFEEFRDRLAELSKNYKSVSFHVHEKRKGV